MNILLLLFRVNTLIWLHCWACLFCWWSNGVLCPVLSLLGLLQLIIRYICVLMNYSEELCVTELHKTVINYGNDETKGIRGRILAANKAYSSLQTIFRSKQIHRNNKIRLYKTLIKPIQRLSKRFEHLLLWPPRSPDLTPCDFFPMGIR